MNANHWIIIACVFVIILLIALAIGWNIRNRSSPEPRPNKYNRPEVWSQAQPSSNPDKNVCATFTFPTTVVNINNVPTAVPPTPSFNFNLLNSLQGVTGYPSGCVDSDQIIAQQLTHTCIAPEGAIDGSITRCFLMSGGTTGINGSEVFFSDVGCAQVQNCPGEMSLVSLNFQAPGNTGIFCIQEENEGFNITMEKCDPSNPDQLFRITRIDPNQNPNSLSPGQGQNGLLAQIFDRTKQLCLTQSESLTVTTYDPQYLNDTSCTGDNIPVPGPALTFDTCVPGITPNSFPGYNWMLLPSLQYCTNPSGCTAKCPGQGCFRPNHSNQCIGNSSCTGYAYMTTPPQVIYTGNIDLSNLPLGTGYNGLTGDSAVISWLIDQNSRALFFGGTGDAAVLKAIGTDVQDCMDRAFISQYLNLTTFNIISNEAVCLANETLGTPNCTGL